PVGDDLAGADVSFHDHAAARGPHRHRGRGVGAIGDPRELIEMDAEGAEARGRAIALRHRLVVVVLRLADVLLRDRLQLQEVTGELERLVRTREIGAGPAVVALVLGAVWTGG